MLVNDMLSIREIELYKQRMVKWLNRRGFLATEVAIQGNSWVAFIRGSGWCRVNDLLNSRPTRIPMGVDYITSTL
jgi:hypothetical protein